MRKQQWETGAPLNQQHQPLQNNHRKEPNPRDHRPLDQQDSALAPDGLFRADVDGEAQQTCHEQESKDESEDQHANGLSDDDVICFSSINELE